MRASAFITLIAAALIFTHVSSAQEAALRSRLQPMPKESGFRMPGYFVWCGSVIKVDQAYHMFASRWPVETKFPEGYRANSEIVRATAARPEGPYTFQQVVIAKREKGKWDSGMAHNPAIYRTGNTYVLFYNASDQGSTYRQIGCATAPSPQGPWTRSDQPLNLGVDSDANNPAACFDEDGSLKLIWRNRDLRTYISVAPSFQGPYKVAADNVWPAARVEDFYYFKQGNRYYLVCEDNAGSITGHQRWGACLTSADGLRDWKPLPDPVMYDHDIRWTDGTNFHATRRERPWLLFEEGKAICLFNGVYDGQSTWNQAVRIEPPFAFAP